MSFGEDISTMDGWGGLPNGVGMRGNFGRQMTLQLHDEIYHGGHYNGGRCSRRATMKNGDGADAVPSFSHHGMFDGITASPHDLDVAAVKEACRKCGVSYPGKGDVKSGRWANMSSSRLEYAVMDTSTGLFASGRGNKDYMVLARPEESMSFSDRDDADAVARAVGKNAVVVDKKSFSSIVSKKAVNDITFPDSLKESDLDSFRVTLNGSTEPYVGRIGNSIFIAKRGSHTSADHVENENLANAVHRMVGLNAPKSKVYKMDAEDNRTEAEKYIDMVNGKSGPYMETVMLAEYIPNAQSLEAAWSSADKQTKEKIRRQILDAYPFESFIAGIDVFQNDNALVDSDGNVWFVDNGAAFDFRARGGRKGWFNVRTDPDDPKNGLMSLYEHPSQTTLRTILGNGVTKKDVLDAARKYDFVDIVSRLPEEYQTDGLRKYAENLNRMSGRS